MVEKCNESQIPALQNEGERVDFSLDPYVAPERGSLDMGDGIFHGKKIIVLSTMTMTRKGPLD